MLNIWSSRDMPLYGKIHIVKTLAIPKLTFVCSVVDTPSGFTTEVNEIIFGYVWKQKHRKLNKATIIKSKNEGGLNMIDFLLFDKALKVTWVKCRCPDDTRQWKFIPLSLLSNVGETLLFQCNYDIRYLDINEHLPTFYRDIMLHCQEINTTTPKEKGDMLNQVIWNNRFIRINKASVYFSNWNQAGVQKLSSFFFLMMKEVAKVP